MATPSSDHHRQTVIAWLDRLQSSVRSPPVRSGLAKNPFQLDQGDSEESDDERKQQEQEHAPPRRASSGSDDSPLSPNTLVDDNDPYADEAVPIGLLAKLAISTSNDDPVSADKKGKDGDNADDDDVVRSHFLYLHRKFHWEISIRLTMFFPSLLTGSCW
jgi:hypothetical protein